MKTKLGIIIGLVLGTNAIAQQQFSGLLNSPRVSLMQGLNNPAELVNLDKKNEITGANFSIQMSNNKIASQDLFSGSNLESKLFNSSEDITMNASTQMTSLGYGLKWKRFGVSISANTYGLINLENINPQLGDALINSGGNFYSIMPMNIQSNKLQQINATLYTDIAAGFGMKLLNFDQHKLSAGINAKLLFPKAFVNIGIDQLNAQLIPVNQSVNALTATGNINIARTDLSTQSITTMNYDFLISDKYNSNSRTVILRFIFEFLNNRELQNSDGEITTRVHQMLYKIGADNFGNTFENNRYESYSDRFYIEYNGVKYYGVDGVFKIKRTPNQEEEYSFYFTGNFFMAPNNWTQSAGTNYPLNMRRSDLNPIVPVSFSGTCLVNNL